MRSAAAKRSRAQASLWETRAWTGTAGSSISHSTAPSGRARWRLSRVVNLVAHNCWFELRCKSQVAQSLAEETVENSLRTLGESLFSLLLGSRSGSLFR